MTDAGNTANRIFAHDDLYCTDVAQHSALAIAGSAARAAGSPRATISAEIPETIRCSTKIKYGRWNPRSGRYGPLGSARPIDMLRTMLGTEQVLDLIGRLEYGVIT